MLHVSQSPTRKVAELRQVQSRLGGVGASNTQIARTSPQSTTRTRPAMTSNAREITVQAPSSQLREYTNRYGLYRVAVPANWQGYEQGSAGAMIAPQNGMIDVNGRNEIVYGAIINHYEPFNGATGFISQSNANSDLIRQITNDSPHLRVAGRSGNTTTLRGTNPNTGITERVTGVTRQLADEHLIYLLFVTPDRDASKYQSTLNAMVRSIEGDTQARDKGPAPPPPPLAPLPATRGEGNFAAYDHCLLAIERRNSNMYDEMIVAPMRQELARPGVQEDKTPGGAPR